MTEKQIQLLTTRSYYVVYSNITKKPYIDEEFSCYMIEDKEKKKEIAKDTYIKNQPTINSKILISSYYQYGIKGIKVLLKGKDVYEYIKIEKKDVLPKFYYNCFLNRNINMLKQTCKKKYLKEMYKAKYIAPVIIKRRKSGEYPKVQYIYATVKKNMEYYVLFSTVDEFEYWNKKQNLHCSPLQVHITDFDKIRKEHPVLINPSSDKLILTDEQIKCMCGKDEASNKGKPGKEHHESKNTGKKRKNHGVKKNAGKKGNADKNTGRANGPKDRDIHKQRERSKKTKKNVSTGS